MSTASTTQSWSNVDYKLEEFIEKFPFPQVVKVKKDGLKSSAFKSSTELVLHESRTIKKVEACVVSEGKKFVIPYDCPAKVYLLTKAEEFSTIGELRKALPTCRYILVTSKSREQQLKALEAGELLTIVFKKSGSGGDVFTCQRKKLGDEICVPASAVGGFSPMATTQERKISDFVRHYSTFPIGIGLSESTISNKAFGALNELVSCANSILIRLTRLYNDYSVIASTTGRKKTMFAIPKSAELTVTAPKPLLLEDSEHAALCKQLHSAVDSSLVDQYLSLAISTGTNNDVVQWSYGQESAYEDVTPLQKKTASKENGETKRDKVTKAVANKTATETKENSKEKTKEKSKEKVKEKEKEKPKEKSKEKEKKTKQPKQKSVEEKPKPEKEANDLVEDESGYLIPAELLKAEREKTENIKVLEGDYEIAESKEKSSKASTFGRLMGKVKGKDKDKDKKKERPSSAAFVLEEDEPVEVKKSSSLPATTSNVKSSALSKDKAKTSSSADMKLNSSRDELDASPSTSPTEKDVKKREKGLFGTAGKKAGAKLRHALGRSKAMDDQCETSKPDSPKETSLPPSPNDEVGEQDMYVAPIDDQLSLSSSSSVQDRPLPAKPPEEPRKISTMSIPYDDDDLYDEINPVPETKNFKIPKDLSKLTVDGVSDVLRYLHMNEHVSKFRHDQIDGEMFKSLDDRLLGALGVADPIQRLKLRKLIKGWRPKN